MTENSESAESSSNINELLKNKTASEFVDILENQFNIHLDPKGRRTLGDLYKDFESGETWFTIDPEDPKELVRNTEPVNIDVFYVSSSGKTYLLHEDKRLTLPENANPSDFFERRVEPVASLPGRVGQSVFERMKVRTEKPETPLEAAVRATYEELDLEIDEDKILPNGNVVSAAARTAKDNSYKGMRARYHKHNFTLVLKEEDGIININTEGVPEPLFEFDADKDRLNLFRWEEIDEIKEISFVDEAGERQTRIITPENSIDILHEIMICEEKKDEYDYALRQEIVRESKGRIETYQAYVKDPAILDDTYEKHEDMVTYLANPNNWLSERAEFHQEIIETEFLKVQRLSEALAEESPTIFMLRGNNGAGKSSLLRTHERFKKVRLVDFEGVINTDFYDIQLRRDSIYKGKHTVTAMQVHKEGSAIERKIRQLAYGQPNLSIIFDKRFSDDRQIKDVFNHAGIRNIEIFDLDVDLEISAGRVLARKKDEDAPIVRFDTLAQGFLGVRNLRDNLITIVKSNSQVVYYLLSDTSIIPPVTIARKEKGETEIKTDQPDRYALITRPISEIEAENLGKLVLDAEFVDRILRGLPTEKKFEGKAELTKYLSRTLEDALEEASKYK